ncbi:ABC transporter substrate-binding protein [Gephyromycinifex aptenodytis]|uniref:ABC transporter substrate-binding protein n=1 Tax=Gephyromycinifex aptenodytis TaxID=2716227 RepID=UPI001448327A|nr:ABC transporter substrate-binding protein [Gephyromycinifex aptenodytis]
MVTNRHPSCLTSRRRFILPVACAASATLLAACGAGTPTPGSTSAAPSAAGGEVDAKGCVTSYTEGKDYFPEKSTIEHAKNFTVSYHGNYQVLEVKQSYQEGPAEKYVLYRCGTPAPEATGELAGAQQIEIPVDSIFSGSTTHIPLLADLDRIDALTGVSSGAMVSNEDVRARLEDKKVVEYAPQQAIDTELVIGKKPDLLMTGGVDDPTYKVLRDSGVPVVANAEWLEATPLGRAEWIKYMAALTGDEAKAEKVFDQIETDYTKVVQAAKTSKPVSVLPGQMFEGTWNMPSGGSYVGALLKDANATYAWSGTTPTGSVPLKLEDVLTKARDADVWLMSAPVQTLGDIVKDDPRYAEFKAFKEGNVWSNNAKVNEAGGNDYWERGVTRPDLVLADLVTILHPDAVPGHELEFYRKVTK